MNPFFVTDFSISDSLKTVRKSVLIYETIIMAFARELNAHVKTDFCIKLPSISKGKLDYQFMEEFIESLKCDLSTIPDYFLDEGYDKSFWYLDNIDQELFEATYASPLLKQKFDLSDREWKSFRLGDIVDDIHNGKSYNASELIVADSDDYIAYVTRTDKNNGIALCVQNNDYAGLEQANAITIGDTTATIYYQTTPFITGPHIIVIRAKWFNIYTATFLITLLNNEKYRYPVFGRSFSKDLISDTNILLPITKEKCPDYEFMENYIKQCSFSCNIK